LIQIDIPAVEAAEHLFIMEHMPNELLAPVLEHLSAVDITNLGSTCRKLEYACADPFIWKRLYRGRDIMRQEDRQPDGRRSLVDIESTPAVSETTSTLTEYMPESRYGPLDFRAEYHTQNTRVQTDWLSEPKTVQFGSPSSSRASRPSPHKSFSYQTAAVWFDNDSNVAKRVFALTDNNYLKAWSLETDEYGRIRNLDTVNQLYIRPSLTSSGPAVPEGVVIIRNRGYFALRHSVIEVDLESMKRVQTIFLRNEADITAMCAVGQAGSIALATTDGLSVFDSRSGSQNRGPRFRPRAILGHSIAPAVKTLAYDPGFAGEWHSDSIWAAGDFSKVYRVDPRNMSKRHTEFTLSGKDTKTSSLALLPHPFIPFEGLSSAASLQDKSSHYLAVGGSTTVSSKIDGSKGTLTQLPSIAPSELHGPESLPSGYKSWKNNVQLRSNVTCVTHTGGSIAIADEGGRVQWFDRRGQYIRVLDLNMGIAPSTFLTSKAGRDRQFEIAHSSRPHGPFNWGPQSRPQSWASFPHGSPVDYGWPGSSGDAAARGQSVGPVRRLLSVTRDGGNGLRNNDLVVLTKTHLGVVRFALEQESLSRTGSRG
jgi:hypothetical protein